MKHLKKISTFPIRKEEFENFLFDLMDISNVKTDYGYYNPNTLVISDIAKDPSGLVKDVPKTDLRGLMISIEFLNVKSIEKTSEFYACLTEAVERFSEKYGSRFTYRDFNSRFLATLIRNKEFTLVGYIFFISI